jgi:intracellular multiplication protein IcmO
MARTMGREDDILLVNFMTGARDVFGPQEKRLSNTLNPFAIGSSSMLTQLVVSMMDSASQSSDGDMWKGRAISFVEALMKMLVYMRDAGHILLDANIIRNYFHLERIEQIIIDKSFPRDNQESVNIEGIPDIVAEPLSNFLLTLPGYDRNKKGKQGSQTLEQHGYITMQLTRVFTSLADTYGHILRVKRAEVDLRDVVLNRRILIVLLPALEKAPAELSSLGKIIISTLKAMMASGLGSDVEGSYRDLIQRKPTNSDSPFMCVLDEYGYYAVEGFAVVPAQARSLGFSAIFAGQDLPAFQKASKEEAASIGANTNIKIAMKLEDPIETWDFFSKTAGESYVTKVDAFQTRPESLMNNYMDTRSASAEKRARLDLLDLKEQREGEAHIFFKSKIIRARMFYAAPKPIKEMRLNHQLRVDAPLASLLAEFERRGESFRQALLTGDQIGERVAFNEELQIIIDTFARQELAFEPLADSIIGSYIEENTPEISEPELDEEFPDDELNIFTPYRHVDPSIAKLVGNKLAEFSNPILRRTDIRGKIELVEKISGRSSKQASAIADDLLRDMQTGTYYPPLALSQPDLSELIQQVQGMVTKTAEVIHQQNEQPNDA